MPPAVRQTVAGLCWATGVFAGLCWAGLGLVIVELAAFDHTDDGPTCFHGEPLFAALLAAAWVLSLLGLVAVTGALARLVRTGSGLRRLGVAAVWLVLAAGCVAAVLGHPPDRATTHGACSS
jgi:hypothetical protein